MKKIDCGQCVFATYQKNKSGYYCDNPLINEKRLIKVCQRYQLGIVSPRWCPIKKGNNNND